MTFTRLLDAYYAFTLMLYYNAFNAMLTQIPVRYPNTKYLAYCHYCYCLRWRPVKWSPRHLVPTTGANGNSVIVIFFVIDRYFERQFA